MIDYGSVQPGLPNQCHFRNLLLLPKWCTLLSQIEENFENRVL